MDLRDYLTRIKSDAEAALQMLPPPASNDVLVKAGGNLQAALDKGGTVMLEAGATFLGNFVVKTAGTRLLGAPGCSLRGAAGAPALFVPPFTRDIGLDGLRAFTAWDQSVIQIGSNDSTQAEIAAAPSGIVLTDVVVPQHRGKRAFELNGSALRLVNCGCSDVFDPAGRDSQGIWIGNAPGDIEVHGGSYSAGSEIILVGGGGGTQAAKVVPQGLVFDGLTLSRPLSWQTDGIKRVVKTSFELKTGRNVQFTNCGIDGVWKDGQDGYAITITPRDGGDIRDVMIDTVTIRNAGSGLNIAGYDDAGFSPQTQRVDLARVICQPEKRFGSGRFVQMGGSLKGFTLDSCHFDGPDSIVLSYASRTWTTPSAPPGQSYVSTGVMLTRNSFVSRSYGLMLTGAQGAGAYGVFWKEAWPDGAISGNTFSGPTGINHKKNLPPDNTFL